MKNKTYMNRVECKSFLNNRNKYINLIIHNIISNGLKSYVKQKKKKFYWKISIGIENETSTMNWLISIENLNDNHKWNR